MSYFEIPRKTFVAGAAIECNTLVSLTAEGVVPCTAETLPVGVAETQAHDAEDVVGVRLINASGTVEVLCSGAVAVGDKLSPAANGAVAKSTAFPVCGIALTAGEDGSLVEMMPLLNLQATE